MKFIILLIRVCLLVTAIFVLAWSPTRAQELPSVGEDYLVTPSRKNYSLNPVSEFLSLTENGTDLNFAIFNKGLT